MDFLANLYQHIRIVIEHPLFNIGKNEITLSIILYLVISIFLLIFISSKIKKLLQNRLLARYNVDIGVRLAISTIIRYVLLVVGFIIIFQAAGIDLSFIAIIIGALGIGIGFGLQNITNNFVSGLVILFERPIKVGDRIEIITENNEKISGDVTGISARASTILTNNNISIIVPNSNIISSTVINWSHNDRRIRFNYNVPVHYKEDPEVVRRLLEEVAYENEHVLKNPAPRVLFSDFGDSQLVFILRIWTTEYIQRHGALKSELYYAVFKKFKENNIELPFPQRDLHLKSGFENLINKTDVKNVDDNKEKTK